MSSASVRGLGGEVKDVEIGPGRFPVGAAVARRSLLCWRLGEKKVGFWHSVDGGFAGRRPVDEDVAPASASRGPQGSGPVAVANRSPAAAVEALLRGAGLDPSE